MTNPSILAAAALRSIQSLQARNLVGGALVESASGETFDVVSPATGCVVAQAAASSTVDVDRAVAAADNAGVSWAALGGKERGKLLARCATLLQDHAEELARIVTLETGKAIRTESRLELGATVDIYQFFAGLGYELKGETLSFKPENFAMTVREPLGVVAAIIPWNVPLMLMALKVGPALIAGNTVVLKSAEQAPFGVLRVAELMNSILPPGVLNVLSGFGPECGAPLVAHPKVAKVTFTGSVETGRIVSVAAAQKLIPATLELGGKSPMIVFPDSDVGKAVAGAVNGMRFTRQGQSCSAASRIFVHADIFDAFVAQLKEKLDALVIGDPFDERSDVGALISRAQFEKVQHYIQVGETTAGATAYHCSQLPSDGALSKGYFLRPVFYTGLPLTSPLVREEIFGPVTVLIPWRDQEQVIALANDTDFGLAATVWTNNLTSALNVMTRLKAGFVQCNQNLVVQAGLSYGGFKTSGLGKEASLESMLEHFTNKKTIMIAMG